MNKENNYLEAGELETLSSFMENFRPTAGEGKEGTAESGQPASFSRPEAPPEDEKTTDGHDAWIRDLERQIHALSDSEYDTHASSMHPALPDGTRKRDVLSGPVLMKSEQASFSCYFHRAASCCFTNLEQAGYRLRKQKCTPYEIGCTSKIMLHNCPAELAVTFYAAAQVYNLDLTLCRNCRPERTLMISWLLQNLNNCVRDGTFAYHEKTREIHLAAQYSFQDAFSVSAMKSQLSRLIGDCAAYIAPIVHMAAHDLPGAEIGLFADHFLADLARSLPSGTPAGLENTLSALSRLMDRPVPSHALRILAWIITRHAFSSTEKPS